MKPNFRSVRQTIYALKRAYGQGIQLCRTVGNSTDLSTGEQDAAQLFIVNVVRAIVAPAKIVTAWRHAPPDVAVQGRPFNFGALWEHSTRVVLISRRDFPGNWPIDTNTFLIFGGKRYEVKEAHDYEEQECIGYIIDALSGTPLEAEVAVTTIIVGPSLPTPVIVQPSFQQANIFFPTSNMTLRKVDSGTVFSNAQTVATTTLTLPADVTLGLTYTFLIGTLQQLKIVANAGETILFNGILSILGGYIQSSTVGSVVTLDRTSPTTWVVMDNQGTWGVQTS